MASKLFRVSIRCLRHACATENLHTSNLRNKHLLADNQRFLTSGTIRPRSNEATGMEDITSAYKDHLRREKWTITNNIEDTDRSNDFFERILSRFPLQNRCFTFAYGSGVFQQVGHNPPKGNMTDLKGVIFNKDRYVFRCLLYLLLLCTQK